MADVEKVIKGLEEISNDKWMKTHADWYASVCSDALALLKEQGETIKGLEDTIRQLNQHIKDLSEYMTPYGKVKDVKAYVESLMNK